MKNKYILVLSLLFSFCNETEYYKKMKYQKRIIYLTFDDGPNRGTSNCINVCLEENIPATFFFIGKNLKAKDSIYFDIVEQSKSGIYIANHSYSHANNKYSEYYKDERGVIKDFLIVDSMLNNRYKIIRMPGRNFWAVNNKFRVTNEMKSTIGILANRYNIIGWDLEWKNSKNQGGIVLRDNVNEMLIEVNKVVARNSLFTEGHIVLLLHDIVFDDLESKLVLKEFIKELKRDKRVVFRNLSFYPNIK